MLQPARGTDWFVSTPGSDSIFFGTGMEVLRTPYIYLVPASRLRG